MVPERRAITDPKAFWTSASSSTGAVVGEDIISLSIEGMNRFKP